MFHSNSLTTNQMKGKCMHTYLGAANCIISTAQQAKPNVIGHIEDYDNKDKYRHQRRT